MCAQRVSAASRVAAVIPALDAEASVGDVVERARLFVDHVLVVDDGSRDATADRASRAGAKVIRHPSNLGKGHALLTAFRALGADFDQFLTLDADGQHLPEDAPRLIAAGREGWDLVIGSRRQLFDEMYWVRRLSNRWSSQAISILAGQPLADVQCGFRLYSRRLIEGVGFPEPRFEAESAIVVRAVRSGFRVTSVRVGLGFADGRTTSHYRPVVDSMRIFGAVARARLEAGRRLWEKTR